jgi:hypothetical protein
LRLKLAHFTDPAQLANVARELAHIERIAHECLPDLEAFEEALIEVNGALWQVEEDLRACEAEGRFDAGFVEKARRVYQLNDRRAALKAQINRVTGSQIVEEKSYRRDA